MKSHPRIPESGAEFINSELGMTLADATVDQLGTCPGSLAVLADGQGGWTGVVVLTHSANG